MRTTNLFLPGWVPISIEVAETQDELRRGLGGRDSISRDVRTAPPGAGATYGMLFPGTFSVWMFPMRFPLDLIFLRDNVITKIAAYAPPGLEQSYIDSNATAVLELPAGWAAKGGLAVGQRVVFA